MEGWGRDLRIATRALARKPAFSFVAVSTLALGIGANTAVYSLVDGVLLEPLPYPDSEELVSVVFTAPGLQLPVLPLSVLAYVEIRDRARLLDDFAIYGGITLNLTGGDRPERLQGYRGTEAMFDVIGVEPALGRTFVEGDDGPRPSPVAVLSDGLWRRAYGADPGVLGRAIHLDGVPTTVVGVMPAGFDFPNDNADLWVPLVVDPADSDFSDQHSFGGIARLSGGATVEEAHTDLERVLSAISEAHPDDYPADLVAQARMAPLVRTRKEQLVGDISDALWVLLGVVGFVLLIACANVANLFLVRAEGRTREVAVRTSLGASPGHVVRYYLVEALVLAFAGGVLGVLVGQAAVTGLAKTAPVAVPRIAQVGLDGSVLAFTALVSIAAAVLFGLFPAMRYAAPSLVECLKDGSRGSTGGRSGIRTRSGLVVIQVALALMLLVGSGLMARSFWTLRAVDPGFEPDGVLVMNVALPEAGYAGDEAVALFLERLAERVGALPGVVGAAVVDNIPLDEGRIGTVMGVEDFPLEEGELPRIVERVAGTPESYETLGLRLRDGRWLQASDSDRSGNVLVSTDFADRFWPDGGALGKRINASSDLDGAWFNIVGVVEQVRMNSLTEEPLDVVYVPLLNPEGAFDPSLNVTVLVKTDLPVTSLTRPVQDAIWQLDPNLPVANPRAMSEVVSLAMASTSFTMVMLAVASAVALLLGSVGIYGVISYMVSQRTREIGVRIALGAPRGTVMRMVIRHGIGLAGIGLLVGLLGAYGLSTVLESLLFGVEARDVATYGAVTVVLGMAALCATLLPARRAVKVDPVVALRSD